MSPTTKPMTFSIGLFPYERWEGVEPMGQVARLADDLGFFGVQIPDHVIMTWRGEEKPPVGVIWYDGFVLSSYLAALTKRVRFIFSVAVVPYRPPVQTAKLISTLDQVSQGRLIFGAGVGWLRGEFRTLGVPFHERGAITSEYPAGHEGPVDSGESYLRGPIHLLRQHRLRAQVLPEAPRAHLGGRRRPRPPAASRGAG